MKGAGRPVAKTLQGPIADPTLSLTEKFRLGLKALRFDPIFDSLSASGHAEAIAFSGATPSVLALHGFTGVPEEVRLVCEAARDSGLETRAPVLPGHGSNPRQLARLSFDDVVRGVRPEFDALRRRGPVIVVGLSMGALVATELYLSAPGDVLGLGLLANAFLLPRPMPGTFLEWMQQVAFPDFGMPKWDTDIADAEARRTHVSYRLQPMRFAASMQSAGKRLFDELFRVHCPTLVVHGAYDRACPVENAWKVAERLGTPDRRVVILPRSRHVICRDLDHVQLKLEMASFFQRLKGKAS